jgi:non-canonical (house-cleaning) NTP pyrophosphatase
MKTITICGSMLFYKEMINLKECLEKMGFGANSPRSFEEMEIINYNKYTQEEGTDLKIKYNLIQDYYSKILDSDAILIANYTKKGIEGYIGGNTLLEMGFAYVNHRNIFMINPAPDLQYKAEIEAMQPIVVGNKLQKIQDYFNSLSKVYLSSDNDIKVQASSFSLKESGYDYEILGFKTNSKVSEQPMSIDETYQGAQNRLEELRDLTKDKEYEYLISIESGLVKLHKNHNFFNLNVCLIENKHKEIKASLVSDVEFPKTMTDLVPSKYPDLGILVQKEYGSKHKDPFRFYTNGKIRRIDLLKFAIKNTVLQFSSK